MVFPTENRVILSLTRQGRQVKVTLEFPGQSEQKAEQEFVDRLKAIYLGKLETETVQKDSPSLRFCAAGDREDESIE